MQTPSAVDTTSSSTTPLPSALPQPAPAPPAAPPPPAEPTCHDNNNPLPPFVVADPAVPNGTNLTVNPLALLTQFTNIKYLPLMPLPRGARPTAASAGGSRKRGQRPSKSNSERGKDFRAKQRQYELDLLKTLTALQREIYDLNVLRNIQQECAFQTRQTMTGSLIKLVREYHHLFYMGIPEVRVGEKRLVAENHKILLERQQQYLTCAFDPELHLGEQRGVAILVEMWKRYTQHHHNLRTRADEFHISGTEDDPIIVAHGTMHARYTRDTLQYLFPHILHDEALVRKFIGKEVVYKYRNVYQFTADGRIAVYNPEVEFVQALLDAGGTIDDVSRLMQQALIASQYILGPVEDHPAQPSRISEIVDPLDNPKLTVDFILSGDDESEVLLPRER